MKQLLLCCFLIIATHFCKAEKYQLSIISVFRDEAPYLKEWIEFHRLVGVEHFYLINHKSEDNYQEVLQPYIDEGIVDLDHCPERIADYKWVCLQQKLCRDKIVQIKDECHWAALIDVDEFLFAVEKDNLVDFLQDYESYGGVCANWQMYGTSGIQTIGKDELLTEKLTWKGKEDYEINKYVKSIVQPKYVDITFPTNSIHYFIYLDNRDGVDENFQPLMWRESNQVSVNKIRINHYWTRDIDYLYTMKIPNWVHRQNAIQYKKAVEREVKTHAVEDKAIWRFLPQLKERMGLTVPDAQIEDIN